MWAWGEVSDIRNHVYFKSFSHINYYCIILLVTQACIYTATQTNLCFVQTEKKHPFNLCMCRTSFDSQKRPLSYPFLFDPGSTCWLECPARRTRATASQTRTDHESSVVMTWHESHCHQCTTHHPHWSAQTFKMWIFMANIWYISLTYHVGIATNRNRRVFPHCMNEGIYFNLYIFNKIYKQ